MTQYFQIEDQVLRYFPEADVALMRRAYSLCAQAHRGHARLPSEPYLEHYLETASLMARLQMDDHTVAACFLHDVLDDDILSEDDLKDQMGEHVAGIIAGVHRVSQLRLEEGKEKQAEDLRKMILAMVRDVRVIFIKLADVLHDTRVVHRFPEGEKAALAREAMEIYAPLASRLGVEWMKVELEDRAFAVLYPDAFAELQTRLQKTEVERRRYIEEVRGILTEKLQENGLNGRVLGRSKHLYSIYRKMVAQHLDLDRIYDLIAFRIITDSVPACYEILALVHALWEPVPGRYKDYIARPKANMYQSLHTTVIGPHQERMEVQIRTEEMDRVANEGIAAHWLYKEGRPLEGVSREETERFSWLRQLLEPEKGWRNPKRFFESFQLDLYPDEVYVFSPDGDVKVLPRGATPIDFAYAVHTEVGHRCVGARVNGKILPLRSELRSGDVVEIITAPNHKPSKDWLNFVKSSKARSRIRHWFKTEERDRSIALGREICEREFRKRGLHFNHYINSPELLEAARQFSLRTVDDLLASIGYKKVSPVQLIGRLPLPEPEEEEPREEKPSERKKPVKPDEGIRVQGVDDVLFRMAKCCNPLPGEPIVGYITRGRGVTIHRRSCKNVGSWDAERQIEVQWDTGEAQTYPVDIKVVYDGDRATVGALSTLLGQLDVTVNDFRIHRHESGLAQCRFRVEIRDSEHLNRVMTALRNEKNVYEVVRVGE
ncbi:RelA/SpoT family protein [Desulfosoma caldarium]|uniref:GTP pyrophosphokinase n=1 Tax=Desulfosoma caldarium TaxID=610254 RepID=A0A3N1UT86_9BACT|nr:bifunctional (p)ppGpp synthetase/guanosine-3',5'-bis(diphosphate) 3'-pyrophosphohydrolase [Desulfosoma caldarium]ROQ93353.1 GTP pyrophosphokinase [Desulfosoma caldarium]